MIENLSYLFENYDLIIIELIVKKNKYNIYMLHINLWKQKII